MFRCTSRFHSSFVFAFLILAVVVPAAAQQTGNFCVKDFRPGATCNANDVRIEQVIVQSITETCAAGVPGEAEVVLRVLVSADGSPDRYDVGLFLALDGNLAIDGNDCFHDYLNPPLTATPVYGDVNNDGVDDLVDGPWWNGGTDGDTCGDIESDTQVLKTVGSIRAVCVDNNGDGSIDMSVCTSWDHQADNNCNGVADAFPGNNAKCSCDRLEIGTPPDVSISVTKSPDTQTILAGGTAVFTITVESNTFVSNVVVSDPQCTVLTGPVGDDGDAILETTETWTYSCTTTNVPASYTNLVTVNGTGPGAIGPVSDSDTAEVVVEAPSLVVAKTPDTQAVPLNGTANFSISVTNNGNVNLTTVVVTDPLCTSAVVGPTGDVNLPGVLEVGEVWGYTCSTANVQSGFINTATATATPPTGPDVSDSDDATVTVNAPSITVAKDPPTQAILVGSNAVFTITVSNSGNQNLFVVQVTDPQCSSLVGPSGDVNLPGVLEVGEAWTYTCTVNNVQVDFTNTVNVTGTTCNPSQAPHGCSNPVDSDTADVDVQAPGLTVTKTPPTQQVLSGGTANFTITVDNAGDVPLTNVTLVDANCSTPVGPSGDTNNDSILDVLETWTYTCSATNVTQPFTNVVAVQATPPTGPNVSGNASADVTVVAPDITAEKSSSLDVDADGDGFVSPGDTLLYTIVITNSGTAAVNNMVFSDAPDLNTALVVGSVTTTQGSVTTGNVAGDTDVAVAVGTLASGGGQVTITFRVTIDDPFPIGVLVVLNQGLVTGDGIPDIPTDDPVTPTVGDPTSTEITPPEGIIGIPTLGVWGIAGLALLLAASAFVALRRRQATSRAAK